MLILTLCVAIFYILAYPFVVWNMYWGRKQRLDKASSNMSISPQKGTEEIDIKKLMLVPRFFFGLSAQVIMAFSI